MLIKMGFDPFQIVSGLTEGFIFKVRHYNLQKWVSHAMTYSILLDVFILSGLVGFKLKILKCQN